MYHILSQAQSQCIGLALIVLSILSACADSNTFEKHQSWLERNYPSRNTNFEKLAKPTRFKADILAGNIVPNMTWAESLVAIDAPPYGPKSVGKVFWCDDKVVGDCYAGCKVCRAMLVTKGEVHLFESGQRGLQVTESFPNNKWLPHLAYVPSGYQAARAILRDEYVVGMHFNDINHVLQPERSLVYYYCNNRQTNRSDIACSEDCASCRVEVLVPLPRSKRQQLIQLFFTQQRLERIEETLR